MTDPARALLDAKLALEAELVRPLVVCGEAYILALHENGGRPLPAFQRMQHVERLETVLRTHYARVAMVMAGKRPPRDPSLSEAALSLRHETSMILRARDQAQRIIASIEREMEREIARTAPALAVADDGTGHLTAKAEDPDLEIKADRERITGVTAGMVGRYRARVPAIANVNTNAPAEEARMAAILDELDVIRPGERLMQTWNSLLDGRERPAHHDAHGQTKPVDEPFEVGGELLRFPGDSSLGASVGNTINCFPAGTKVSGDVFAATRHWYDGELVEITTRLGHKLSGTPNHPVLTPEGWVALGALHEGSHVISRSDAGRDQSGRFVDGLGTHHVHDVEPCIEQVFDALATGRRGVRVSNLAVNFHGDRPAHDVDVVTAERPLRFGRDSSIFKHLDQLGFAPPGFDAGALFPRRFFRHFGIAGLGSSAGVVGGASDRASSICVGLGEADDVGFAAGSQRHASIPKRVCDHGSANSETFGHRQDRLASVVSKQHIVGHPVPSLSLQNALSRPSLPNRAGSYDGFSDRFWGSSNPMGDSQYGHPGSIEIDCVLHISSRQFVGHVFNLQSQHEMYYANGVVVHNCRCFLTTFAVDEAGNRRLIHTGPSAPARRMKRPNETLEQAKPRLNPTANIRLNGRSRANLVLHDKNKTIAQLRQVKPNLIEVRVGNRVIARAETNPSAGTVTKITVSKRYRDNGSDVEGIIRRSVALSAQ